LVAIKVLATGYYASQNIKTPVKIAVVVLIITQLLNLVLVPLFAHAGLALSIGIGALINALWLLVGLIRSRIYQSQRGWAVLMLRVVLASCVLGAALSYASHALPWTQWPSLAHGYAIRILSLAGIVIASGIAYFAMLAATGLPLKQLVKHHA
jgi:putative peptidoglycan lipid II flippase